jgi:mannose-6-phosphate isomerase
MPAGRVHSLGPGILLTEIQQTSDATYRIYDWERADDSGNPRELHVEQALEAIDYDLPEEVKRNVKSKSNESIGLVDCPYFTTKLIELAQPLRKNYEELDSFVLYICLEGRMTLKYTGGQSIHVQKGEIVLIPAMLDQIEVYPDKKVKFLEIYIS